MNLHFEWDERKVAENVRKHGISFDEAKSVFDDPLSITMDDPDDASGEDRFIDIGVSVLGRLLVVVYTERDGAVRLISARMATASERTTYEHDPF